MRGRSGLAHLMALIVVLAAGLGAMRSATVPLTRLVVYSALLALLIATVGAAVRRLPSRIGLAVFGWGYAVFVMPVPILNNGHDPSIVRDSFIDVWRLDGPAGELAVFYHPQTTEPTDPDQGGEIHLEPSTGLYTKVTDAGVVPCTPDEIKAKVTYDARLADHQERANRAQNAQLIALTIQGAVFALAGSLVGRAFAGGPAAPSGPPAPDPRAGVA